MIPASGFRKLAGNTLKRLARPRGIEPLTPRSVVWSGDLFRKPQKADTEPDKVGELLGFLGHNG